MQSRLPDHKRHFHHLMIPSPFEKKMPSKLGKKKRLSTFLLSATYENAPLRKRPNNQKKKSNIHGIFGRGFHAQQQQAAPKQREKKSTENQLLQNCNHRGAWVPATSHWPSGRFDRCSWTKWWGKMEGLRTQLPAPVFSKNTMVDGSEAFLQVEIRIFHTWPVGNAREYHPHGMDGISMDSLPCR